MTQRARSLVQSARSLVCAQFLRKSIKQIQTLNVFFLTVHCFSFPLFYSSVVTICEKMSELTERSKCVFQAKLAEQAERYDGASVHSALLFLFRAYFYTHTRRRERTFGENGPDLSLSPPFFCSNSFASRARLLSLSLFSLARVVISTPTMRAFLSLSLSLTFFLCVNLPFSCRDDRGVEEALRDSGHRVDGAL
jgi:hypothetical protein